MPRQFVDLDTRVTVGGASSAPPPADVTIFPDALTPVLTDANDGTDYTLGTRFTRSVNGTIRRGRWFFPLTFPGIAQWVLYSDAGAELARQAFVAPILGAWNETPDLAVPINFVANTILRCSIYTPQPYTATVNFFSGADYVNGDVTAFGGGGNGWLSNVDSFPSNVSGNAANFFADVVFA
jgi:hypothetical protein